VTDANTSRRVTVPQRILFGLLALAVMLGVAWGDAAIALHYAGQPGAAAALLAHGSVIPIATALMCLVGCSELLGVLRGRGAVPCARIGYVFVALCILAPWLGAGSSSHADPGSRALYASMFSVALGVVATGAAIVFRQRAEGTIRDAGATLLVFTYVGVLPSFAVHVRSGVAGPGPDGAWLLLGLLLVIKASDIGAYFTGTYLGRHKLIPNVSPGKSVEGAIGGIVLSGLIAALLVRFSTGGSTTVDLGSTLNPGWGGSGFGNENVIVAFLSGAALSIAAQIGDLLESCFKRDAGIKDSGHVLPRFGGVLDLVDSPLLALPVAWMILTMTR